MAQHLDKTGSQEAHAPQKTRTITVSLPAEIVVRADEVMKPMKQQGRSRSEFLRDSMLRYIEECEFGGT